MSKLLTYPLRIERHDEGDGYLAYFPDLPGCQTWGESYEAAIENAEEALAVYLETLIANGDPLPEVAEIAQPKSDCFRSQLPATTSRNGDFERSPNGEVGAGGAAATLMSSLAALYAVTSALSAGPSIRRALAAVV